MQRLLNSETGVNKPFENVSCQGRIQKFFEERGIDFRHFSSVIFPEELFLSILSAKNDSRGVRGQAPLKNFWKLAYYHGHFSVFWAIFYGKFSYFWPLTSSASPMMHFVRTVSIMYDVIWGSMASPPPPVATPLAVTIDNAKTFSEFMSKSRSLATISERKLQPLLVWEIID